MEKMGDGRDVAYAALFLTSDEAKYLIGMDTLFTLNEIDVFT